MITLLLWFGILSSGGALGAAICKKKYEEMLPITASVLVLLLFLCGIMGILKVGAVLVCILGAAVYVCAGIWVVRKKNFGEFVKNFFSPGFLIFTILFLFVCYFNFGKLADSWDEFSHWADIVKVMATLDTYGTNPEAYSLCQSYPPGMSLFQYFLQKLSAWTGGGFTEWQLYVAYQVLVLIFMLPFVKNLHIKQPLAMLVSMAIIFICPLLFYQSIYAAMYIDPFLGVLSGSGLATVFLCKERDAFYSLRVLLTCAMLVLAKDAGMLFAVFLGGAYVLDMLFIGREEEIAWERRKLQEYSSILYAILAIGVPRWLWSLHLKLTHAKVSFTTRVDISQLLDVIFKRDHTYRRWLWGEYYRKLITQTISLGDTNIRLSYLMLLFLLLSLFLILGLPYRKDEIYPKKSILLVWTMGIQFAVYIIGLCVTYMFKFSEYEATNFASFDRYINIVFLAAWIVCAMVLVDLLQKVKKEENVFAMGVLSVIVVISPMGQVYNYATRAAVTASIQTRSAYAPMVQEIEEHVEERSHIYFVSQEDNGFDYWVVRYSARPNIFSSGNWSIGESFYSGDIWTQDMTADEWQAILLDGYDYVALYRVNDYFLQNFSGLFEDELTIENNSLYKVNKESGLLERCE